MNKFIDRKQELDVLNKTFESKDSLILINGPHHIGKTELVKKFIEDKPYFYYSACEFSDELNRKQLLELIREIFPNPLAPTMMPSWEELFSYIALQTKDKKSVLVIDNLDNIIQSNPDFLDYFVNIWEKVLKPHKLTTILILPNNSTLTRVEKNTTFNKELNLRLQLKPIPFFELIQQYPEKPIYELVSLYNITGGYPLYWDYFISANSLVEQFNLIVELMTDPKGFFYDLPLSLLQRSVWDTPNYATILYYLAHEINTFQELLKRTKLKKNQLLKYLNNLEILGYVGKEKPLLKRRNSYKKYHYYISNPLFKFWFRFVYPNRSLLNKNELVSLIINEYADYIEKTFSNISNEIFVASIGQNLLGMSPTKYGTFWNNNIEIPLVAIDDKNKKIFFADKKFSLKDYGLENFIDFVKSTLTQKEFRKYKDYDRLYGLFTANTPSEDLMRYALNNDDTIIFSGTKLVKK